MADHGLLIEFGSKSGGPESLGDLQEALASFQDWKERDLIEEYRWYVQVTGNRQTRSLVIVLECSASQLEHLVGTREWGQTADALHRRFENFSNNRLLFGDRLQQLAKEMFDAR